MRHVNYFKILFLIIGFISSCASFKLPSTYVSERNKIGPDAFEITIKPDSTFSFVGWSDVLGEERINGKWSLYKDTLYFAVEPKQEKQYIRLTERGNKDLKGIRIKSIDERRNESLTGAEIYFNNNDKPYKLGLEDEIFVKEQGLDSIRVKYLEIDEFIAIKNPAANDFTIYINLDNKKLEVFKVNEKWVIKRRNLVPINNENKRLSNEKFIRK